MKPGWVYILTNRPCGTLYIGVTADLVRRISEHRSGQIPGFTQDYNLKQLAYFERYDDITTAIAREKAMKKWRRDWKIQLIEGQNPRWDDLYRSIL